MVRGGKIVKWECLDIKELILNKSSLEIPFHLTIFTRRTTKKLGRLQKKISLSGTPLNDFHLAYHKNWDVCKKTDLAMLTDPIRCTRPTAKTGTFVKQDIAERKYHC